MGLRKIFCSTTIIVGLFISVDYGLCDEFRCRGNERERRSDDAGDWSWQSHFVWTFVYIVGLALWSLNYTLLEGRLVVSGCSSSNSSNNNESTSLKNVPGVAYCGSWATLHISLFSARDSHSLSSTCHLRPLLQITDESQQEQPVSFVAKQHRQIMYMRQQYCDPDTRRLALPIALWLHLVTMVLVLALCWTDMTSVVGKGSSAAEFWNLTRNGLYCHFGGHNKVTNNLNDEVTSLSIDETCQQVAIYAWPFLVAYILFMFSSLHFLIISESAVFTVAVSTIALPLAGIWWSLFRMVGVVTPSASGKGSLKEKC
ncbi:hypothetical protein Cfor_01212 [Coptotermes formosanus]|uniref:Uncharacterized protein n=1 Tax=Coptotermes formosanus TaxID=36987 RepID=A0A6L2Q0V7_COPFO|nr:hypothetical protein Cfor_01212 [Coptotermes formosanus]